MATVIKHPQTGEEFLLKNLYQFENTRHGGRRPCSKRRYIIVHHTAGTTAGDLRVLRGLTGADVSVKFLIADPGDGDYRDDEGRLIIWQLLPNEIIGWSVGRTSGEYGYVNNSNSDSIEISNRGRGGDPFEEVQAAAVETLIAYEEKRCGADVKVFGHREVSPGRKVDPHASFDLEEIKDFAAWVRPDTSISEGEPTVPEVQRRVVGVETNNRTLRHQLIQMLVANNAAHTVLGRSVFFHDALADVKEVEAFIALNSGEMKRTHGIRVADGTHTPLTVPPPHGQFTMEEAFGESMGESECAASLLAAQAMVGALETRLRQIRTLTE